MTTPPTTRHSGSQRGKTRFMGEASGSNTAANIRFFQKVGLASPCLSAASLQHPLVALRHARLASADGKSISGGY